MNDQRSRMRNDEGFSMVDALTAIAVAALGFTALLQVHANSRNAASLALNETEALHLARFMLDQGVREGAGSVTYSEDDLLRERRIGDFFRDGVLDDRFEEVVVQVEYRKRRTTDIISLQSLRAKPDAAQ